ncbi:MAG: alanine racemase [Eggerthellaceae bacterium]|jgi:alanine racemase
MRNDNDLPNGFTGYARRRAGFEPASEEVKKPLDASRNRVSVGFDAREALKYAKFDTDGAGASVPHFDPDKLATMDDRDKRWAWVEINLNAIRHNVMEAKRVIGKDRKLLAVVKADAYGHGAVQVAKLALNSGAEYLGVATVQEGIELRENMVGAPILLLSQPPAESIPALLAYKIMPSIYDEEFAIRYGEIADLYGQRAPYHLAVNTGMNRIGVQHDEVVDFMHKISFHRALDLVGVFTHFATADCPETLDFGIQARRFNEAIQALRAAGINPGIVHCANSAALIRYPEVQFDMVRLGIAMYGYYPCPETVPLVDLHPAMSVHARITDTRLVPMSEGVSYGLHYRSPGSVKICTIPVGYADGLRRGLSSKTNFVYKGRSVRQVGNICMDQCMFEIDMRSHGTKERLDPQVGDEVLVVGEDGDAMASIQQMADTLDSIPHEITIGFSHRMPRYYINK